jgi:cell division protein FtsZ
LLESSIEGASGVVLNVTGGNDLTLHEVNEAAAVIFEVVDPNANIIFGAVIDEKLQGELRITVIATGFNGKSPKPNKSKSAEPAVDNGKPSSNSNGTPPAPPSRPADDTLDIPDFLRRRRPPLS